MGNITVTAWRDKHSFQPARFIESCGVGIEREIDMKCQYCLEDADLVTGDVIYPHLPYLHHKKFYRCVPCKAHVGCHPNSDRPLGRLANAELRRWKQAAHSVFDPLWKSGGMKRSEAYKWLADMLCIHKKQCHIGSFDIDMCKRVIEHCEQREANHG